MCPHCAAGLGRIKLRRQWIHRIGWRNIVCEEAGIMSEGSKRVSDPQP